jgi:hypothetical protein
MTASTIGRATFNLCAERKEWLAGEVDAAHAAADLALNVEGRTQSRGELFKERGGQPSAPV